MTEPTDALTVSSLSYRYGDRVALDRISFAVRTGEIFGLLGPNGGGKTTLFRVLSTLFAPQTGSARIFDLDLSGEPARVRGRLGVVFQSPSLDGKLTVAENLKHQGHLYGMSGKALAGRIAELLEHFRLGERAGEKVETLSGGQQRRVEIAKALLHRPRLLLLDEPSTGLDPGARIDLWALLHRLRREDGVTVLLTTHLMEEAERCDRVAILDRGTLVACDAPATLRAEVGGEVLSFSAAEPGVFAAELAQKFSVQVSELEGELRVEHPEAARLLAEMKEAFPGRIRSARLGQPTLEDVFIRKTGHRLNGEEPA